MSNSTDYRLVHFQDLLGSQYRIDGVLGQGGAAIVYKVTNLRLDRTEALKVLNQDHQNAPDFSRRFMREVKLAAALDHPNIIKVYDFGMDEGLFWYSMQFIDGPTLDRVLASKGPLSAKAVVRIAVPLLDALQYIHEHSVVHRDVKPGNIILDTVCRPYLMDFGIAKSLDSLKKTQTMFILGTPAYLSPEQVAGSEIDSRSDIYSIGVTFYELLTGKLPFSGNSVFASIMSRLHRDPVPLREACPELDPRFQAIVMCSLEREREKRFSTAAEMRDRILSLMDVDPELLDGTGGTTSGVEKWLMEDFGLTNWIESNRATQVPATALPITPKRSKRNLFLGAGVMGIIVLVVLGIFMTKRFRTPPDHADGASPTSRPVSTATVSMPRDQGPSKTAPPSPAGSIKEMEKTADQPARAKANQADKITKTAIGTIQPEQAAPSLRRAVQPPQLMERPPVQVPAEVVEKCRGQMIGVSVTIGDDGRVKNSRLLSAVPPECGKAALDVVRQYIYRPALDASGKPVETTIGVSVELY